MCEGEEFGLKNVNEKKKMASERQSNIELCRLASILLVMLVHTTVNTFGWNMSLGTYLLEGFTVIGVNVFVLITGYFSTIPKKTSLVNLAFICLFWMVIKVICRYEYGEPCNIKDLFFLTTSNWFIPSYIGLLFFSPILNSFCKCVNSKMQWGVVITLLIIEIWFDLLPPRPDMSLGTQRGYSVYSFVVLYLLARAIRLYGLPAWFKKISPFIYVACSVVLGVVGYSLLAKGYANINGMVFAYSNPLIILSSVSFLMMFERIHFQSNFINHVSKSTLAVLLGHTAIFFLYQKQFKYIYDNFSGLQVVIYWILSITIVFCACIAIDQIRLLIYRPIDKLIKTKIKNNNIFEENK